MNDHITERHARQVKARRERTEAANNANFASSQKAQTDLARLKAERDELRCALAQCLRRLDKLNEGGPNEPDPTVVMVRAILARTDPDAIAAARQAQEDAIRSGA